MTVNTKDIPHHFAALPHEAAVVMAEIVEFLRINKIKWKAHSHAKGYCNKPEGRIVIHALGRSFEIRVGSGAGGIGYGFGVPWHKNGVFIELADPKCLQKLRSYMVEMITEYQQSLRNTVVEAENLAATLNTFMRGKI